MNLNPIGLSSRVHQHSHWELTPDELEASNTVPHGGNPHLFSNPPAGGAGTLCVLNTEH
ncbi:hypothetical protein JYU34_014896 [Plutella xylostella]|uniref:Uncharacterized protein n=1 Tax=Plutella xylostella TaxID=51655 RepID=A0ABQ7Q5T5_PLUXY|nr:hypothetical protein JYU34_014896 [Plutella xylostella]